MTTAANNLMRLDALLTGFADDASLEREQVDVEVSGVCLDTRLLVPGDLYLAMSGSSSHGMQFVNKALDAGAVAVVTDQVGLQDFEHQVALLRSARKPLLLVPELKQQAGDIAARFFSHPSKSVQVVAVTGTDGKTSVCRFIADALNGTGRPCGYIGTLGWGLETLTDTQLTTPDAATLQRSIAVLRDAGASVVVLEASSHGLEEGRLDAVDIDIAVLTNFGRDHLDYHKSTEAYKAAKARLFSWPGIRAVVLNGADELGAELALTANSNKVVFYPSKTAVPAAKAAASDIVIHADAVQAQPNGLCFDLIDNTTRFKQQSPLLGLFNVENLLACHGVLRALGQAANDACASLQFVQPVRGRMEQFSADNSPTAVVDYAHTPQALEAAITAARAHCHGALWVVFGCGGDRDAGKRGPMGRAAEMADHVIVTDDNPRTENSASIIEQILAGMVQPERATVIADRPSALAHAMQRADNNDLVLIAGKGHESYQIVGADVLDYSDRDTVQKLLQVAS